MRLQTGGLPSFAGLHYLMFSQVPQKSKLKRKLGCSMILVVRFELILRILCTFHFALNLDMLGSDDQLGHGSMWECVARKVHVHLRIWFRRFWQAYPWTHCERLFGFVGDAWHLHHCPGAALHRIPVNETWDCGEAYVILRNVALVGGCRYIIYIYHIYHICIYIYRIISPCPIEFGKINIDPTWSNGIVLRWKPATRSLVPLDLLSHDFLSF